MAVLKSIETRVAHRNIYRLNMHPTQIIPSNRVSMKNGRDAP